MSLVMWKPRTSRLSAIIDTPGGLSVGVAMAQARDNLEALKAQGQEIVAERIARLAALRPPVAGHDPILALNEAYEIGRAVIDAAGPFDRDDLCKAAAGLCDLIDAAEQGAAFDWRIVTVHAQALQLILGLPPEADAVRTEILANLDQMVKQKIPTADQSAD
ncbi:chemotaxis protein CheE [Brevundimonas sp.]|uniref:chemotaxis protein CheE n=1 Tax=Brevundimonas sp. TaxID=1871086 RepID=UPI00286ADDD1|nr:chemotaxis protein CheE [Brevundimonas sp.]